MILMFLACPVASSAQPSVAMFGYSLSMGSVTVDQEQLYRLSLRPDFPLGRLGIGLDLELFVERNGDLGSRGWEAGSSTQTLDSILRKIYYVRYGRPNDAVYVKIGALDDVTLGYGLIMDNYRNTLHYPGIKKTGFQFRIANFAGTNIGLEGVINNLQDFQEGGALIGLRTIGYAADLEVGVTFVADLDQYSGLRDSDSDGVPDPIDAFPEDGDFALDNDHDGVPDHIDSDDDNDGIIDADAGSGLPADIASALLGLNANYGNAFPIDQDVERHKPFNKNRVGQDFFSILGVDLAYPLIRDLGLELKLYGQFAMLIDDDDGLSSFAAQQQGVYPGNRQATGFGFAAPGLWLSLGPLNGQLDFRHFRRDFDSRYFDELYELDRAYLDLATGQAQSKDARLGYSNDLSGFFGHLGTELGSYAYASVSYQHLTGTGDPKQQLIASASLSRKLLKYFPHLKRAYAYFHKNNIGRNPNEDGTGRDDFFEPTEDTFYGFDVGLNIKEGASVRWDTRFVFERSANRRLQRHKIMTLETVFDF
ncbi:MAG: hypothetical protein F4Y91_20760 [Gemmatimonadetes bacterium]|nr:hypothetical protein [Gemmatimonadota bacterium]MXY84415.1 hypothetical protein [Gemmatimonadota bacterium]MYB70541.1 hypothetical protein [Gemmatimonadota bacterium]